VAPDTDPRVRILWPPTHAGSELVAAKMLIMERNMKPNVGLRAGETYGLAISSGLTNAPPQRVDRSAAETARVRPRSPWAEHDPRYPQRLSGPVQVEIATWANAARLD
jgi:hypothetical protein